MATAEKGDADTLTTTIIDELKKSGLSTDKILSQVYDGASLMSGKYGGVQKLLKDKLGRDIPYVHCFNHQLHLVIVHAMSVENAVEEVFHICNLLYKFFRKPTISIHYKGQTLKQVIWRQSLSSLTILMIF